jgi:hypothetical protein
MGQPPASLLPSVHSETPNAPIHQPALYTQPAKVLQLLPNPPPSHPLHIPPYKSRPAINIQQNPWSAQWSGVSQSPQWSNNPSRVSVTPETQPQQSELKHVYPRPLAPSPPTEAPVPPMPPYHRMSAQSNNQGQNWTQG